MAQGQGRSDTNKKDVTRKGKGPKSPQSSQGETPGAGSYYEATLVEWENKANTRNQGPERGGPDFTLPSKSRK
jgi:hypothetical protein